MKMETLKRLVDELGYSTSRTIIESQVLNPKTVSLKDDEAIFSSEYDQ